MRGAFQSPLVHIYQNIYKFLLTELRIGWLAKHLFKFKYVPSR